MDLMRTLQNALQGGTQAPGGAGGTGGIFDGLSSMMQGSSGLLGPAALGGLVGALLTSKAARGVAGGALLAGGGAFLWNKYKERMQGNGTGTQQTGGILAGTHPVTQSAPGNPAQPPAQPPVQGQAPGPAGNRGRAERLIRALVFAAKSDGHIDAAEEAAVMREIGSLGLGTDAEHLVRQALAEPLDPDSLAAGVESAGEALELYTISCAVITVDHFMERGYLDALAKALQIPEDVKADIESRVKAAV